jgi:hypothetical protein
MGCPRIDPDQLFHRALSPKQCDAVTRAAIEAVRYRRDDRGRFRGREKTMADDDVVILENDHGVSFAGGTERARLSGGAMP